ncbi:MAG: hypothetical protein ACK4N5_25625, partial [Myxococcales bacterium]
MIRPPPGARPLLLLAALASLTLGGCQKPALAPERAPAPASQPADAAWHRSAVVYGVVPTVFGDGVPLREVTNRLE